MEHEIFVSPVKRVAKTLFLLVKHYGDIYLTIGAYKRMTKFFRTKYMVYPLLSLWVQDMPNTDRIENRFKRVFDEKGGIAWYSIS